MRILNKDHIGVKISAVSLKKQLRESAVERESGLSERPEQRESLRLRECEVERKVLRYTERERERERPNVR